MTGVAPISDEDLVAYLDDALDGARRKDVERAMEQDQSLRDRLSVLDIDKGELRAAFEMATAEAPVDRLRLHLAGHALRMRSGRARSQWFKVAAAAIVGVGLGYAIGVGTIDDKPKSWQFAIADYQSLYVTATLASITGDPVAQRGEVALVGATLGLPITFEALQVSGFDYKRAQLLQFKGAPLVQFAYLDQAGRPTAFCAMRTGEADSPIRTGAFHGLPAAFWTKNGYGFIVIGAVPIRDLERAATTLAQRI